MRHLLHLGVSVACCFAASARGANVAIIDSGVDIEHHDLAAFIWTNAAETAANSVDDDGNGLVDDVHGWSFADDSAEVLNRSLIGTFPDDDYRYFQLQGRILRGTATDEEREWMRTHKEDTQFMTQLESFGNFVHGSHVSGIASASRTTERIIPIKIIPTRSSELLSRPEVAELREKLAALPDDDPLTGVFVKLLLSFVAQQNSTLINQAVDYAAHVGADVANGSFGVSAATIKPVIKQLLQGFLGSEPTDEQIAEYSAYLIGEINTSVGEKVRAADRTLFVFAAANDGADNDASPVAPANIGADNTISVAASLGFGSLATFSNYGATTVDVAAPGVVINSTIPGNLYMELSGTSMAAPAVAEVAALVKDANPALTPAQMKRILVETVDVKSFLAAKVRSGGVVNSSRAVAAATLSRDHELSEAIASARTTVADVADAKTLDLESDGGIEPIALPSFIH